MISNSGTTSLGLYDFKRQIDAFGGVDYFRPNLAGGYLPNARVMLNNGEIVQNVTNGNLTNDPNTDMTGWEITDKKSSVNTITELSTIQNPKDGDSVYVKGYYAPENFALLIPYIGGGFRTYVESRKTENDEMFCVNGWVLDNYENAYQVGARAKAGFDNLDIFQTILDIKLPLILGSGVHGTRYPVVADTDSTIIGANTNDTIIRKTTRNKVTDNPKQASRQVVFPVIGGGGATYSIDVDAILVTAPKDYSANFNYHLRIDNVTFDRELPDDGTNYMVHHNASFTPTGYGEYGWFFPYWCQSIITNSRCLNNRYGIYTINNWMNLLQRVQWRASSGVVFGGLDGDINRGGTSTNLTDCWVTDVMGGAGHWAWRIHNMDYSFWSSIGTDFVGKEGETPADGVLLVTSGTTGADTTLTISGFGSEVVHAKQYLKASGKLTLKGSSWTALDWFNKYGTQSTYLFEATDEAKVSIDLPNFKFMHEVDNPSASYYAEQPKFAVASWGATLEFIDPKVSPKITGKNDTGRFGLQAFQNSTIRFKTRTSDLVVVAGTDDDALENPSDHNKFITNQGIQSDSIEVDSGMVAPTACRWDTNQLRLGNQYLWYSPTYDKWLYSTVKPISETSGSVLGDDSLAGSTANRPTTYPLRRTGGCYFDQTIGKPIWWDGSAWKDANGTNV